MGAPNFAPYWSRASGPMASRANVTSRSSLASRNFVADLITRACAVILTSTHLEAVDSSACLPAAVISQPRVISPARAPRPTLAALSPGRTARGDAQDSARPLSLLRVNRDPYATIGDAAIRPKSFYILRARRSRPSLGRSYIFPEPYSRLSVALEQPAVSPDHRPSKLLRNGELRRFCRGNCRDGFCGTG